ncbi:uncharacterized protein TNCV_1281451 [Trichonephila clavipes]|nr:uncharacterized protein TNCV_1281451 [Trichonephila clavipes]
MFGSSLKIEINTFLKSSEILREIPASVRTVERRITQMAENVNAKQNSLLQESVAFVVALDESKDVNDAVRLGVIARYCDKNRIYEELYCMIPLSDTAKGQDILFSFINHFERKNIK